MKRIALITGGSRGIGRACVKLFAREGYTVIFFCRERIDLAEELALSLRGEGRDVYWRRVDIADGTRVNEAVGDILALHRHIDVLVNNAAIAQIKLFTELTDDDWERVFDVNVKGAFNCTRAVLPAMISRKMGAIVNVASMWGEVGASCEVAYSAAKAAVIGMTKALAKEVGPSGIRVNCVSPGVIDTDMNGELDEATRAELAEETPLGRVGTPEEAARAALFLAGEGASFITGQVLGVSGGFCVV